MKSRQDIQIIPCEISDQTRKRIEEYAESLRDAAPGIGNHEMPPEEFWDSGIFRGAIERLRGEQAASMGEKRALIQDILDWMRVEGRIQNWHKFGAKDRHDYEVELLDGRICAIEAKGCLDGNNTNIYKRPANADEFVIWSLCQNPMADPRKNAWSGIHTRLGAEIIDTGRLVDGLVIWDQVCNTASRPCPKIGNNPERLTRIGARHLPPPCIYLFPRTIPDSRNNSDPKPHQLHEVSFLHALHTAFGGWDEEITEVWISVKMLGASVARSTKLVRDGKLLTESPFVPVKRART